MESWDQVIPTVSITQNHVNTNLQCTVCCENFKVRESASLLECAHMFHPSCIHPWLRLKTTCPVCRHDLQAREEDNSDPEVTFSDGDMQAQEDNQLSTEDSSQSEISTSSSSSDGELQNYDDPQLSTEEDDSSLEISTSESSLDDELQIRANEQILIEENDLEMSALNSSSDEVYWI
ncbi:E3 ubiquitin-protein ligase RNF126-like [Homalodisca vitripennis]|uniref:E3 ubiquitin-protein ligase RNF126-like n=1 Tax=Homalodisca vitripennis TaxID=197043 RepID=UPI001EEC6FBC|nr:E3 ubiquitin-protein ligase RNF126-like [Homalodisca vitripennis]